MSKINDPCYNSHLVTLQDVLNFHENWASMLLFLQNQDPKFQPIYIKVPIKNDHC